jgi:hypothetical protein
MIKGLPSVAIACVVMLLLLPCHLCFVTSPAAQCPNTKNQCMTALYALRSMLPPLGALLPAVFLVLCSGCSSLKACHLWC